MYIENDNREFEVKAQLENERKNIKSFDDLVSFLERVKDTCNTGYGTAQEQLPKLHQQLLGICLLNSVLLDFKILSRWWPKVTSPKKNFRVKTAMSFKICSMSKKASTGTTTLLCISVEVVLSKFMT